MSNYIVSARKYRPARFSEVVGQGHISQTLRNALATDHVAHAYLFCGPRGVGKTTNARILAKILNCQNRRPDHEACGECASCKSFEEQASFNIFELDAASNNSVEAIRGILEQVRFPPQSGRYKVFIIDEVHMLSQAAFNAFLKTLEEPPPYAIFILATTEKHKILPTILSRCQIFDFRRISVADMVDHLRSIAAKENIDIEDEALHIIAQKADGGLRDALSIFDRIVAFAAGKKVAYATVIENLNVLDYDYYFQITDGLMAEDLPKTLNLFDQILRKGFEPDIFMNGLAEHLRNILVAKDEATLILLEASQALRERYRKQAALAPTGFLLTGLAVANDCDVNYKMARAKRLHVEMALIRLAFSTRALRGEMLVAAPAFSAQNEEKKSPDVNDPAVSTSPKEAEKTAVLTEKATESAEKGPILAPEPAEATTPASLNPVKKTSFSLDAFEAEVAAEEAAAEQKSSRLTVENLQTEWLAFAEAHDSNLLRTNMKTAELSIEKGRALAVVGGETARSMIISESKLMDFLRERLHEPTLALDVRVDEQKAAQNRIAAPPRKLSGRELLEKMNETNPLVGDLVARMDLRLED